MSNAKKVAFSGMFIALGLLIPQVFHMFGGSGSIFLPMHIPVLLAGFFLGTTSGTLVGAVTPILSSLMTGMPPVPIVYFMIVELAAYGLFAGFFYKQRRMNAHVSLILAMICGRLALAAAVFVLVSVMNLKIVPLVYLTGAISKGLIGMVIQIGFIPVIVKALEKAFRHA